VLERTHPEQLVSLVGNMTRAHLQQAQAIRLGFSSELISAAREPAGAMAIIYALLLSSDAETQAGQNQIPSQEPNPAVCERTKQLLPEIRSLDDRFKLPLIDLALPALRQLTPPRFQQFNEVVRHLIECDRAIDLFEYTLQRILFRHLQRYFDGVPKATVRHGSVNAVLAECVTLLSGLAYVGQDNPEEVEAAFQRGAGYLDAPGKTVSLLARHDCNLPQIDAALNRLAATPPSVKRNILLGCAQTVATDGQVTAREAELLRAIADSLDCPVPPFVEVMRNEETTAPCQTANVSGGAS
jgi:hypothetical protein